MRTYLRLLAFTKPFAWLIPQYFVLVVLHTIFRVVNFGALVPVLNILFNQTESVKEIAVLPQFSLSKDYFIDTFYYYLGNAIAQEGKIAALYLVVYVLVASILFSNLFLYLANVLQARIRVDSMSVMRKQVFDHISQLHLGFFSEQRRGDIMARITTDIQQIENTVVNTLRVILKEPLMIIAFFITLFAISPSLTLYTMLLIPISGGIISAIARRLKRRAQRSQQAVGKMSSIVDEALGAMRIIKAFNARGYIASKFNREVDVYRKQNLKIAMGSNLVSPLSEFLGVGFIAVILVIGGTMILSDQSELDAASFLFFLIIFSQILTPAKAMSNAFSNIQKGIASGERVFELLDEEIKIKDANNPTPLTYFKDRIKFDKVSFSYAEKEILKQVTFEIPKGKVVALVGPSGGGKSTIASLLPRYYDTTVGQIVLDGVPLNDYSIKALRAQMGVVTQEAILFNDTIFQNIAFGDPSASQEEVERAAKLANAHEFILQMGEGYQTPVGDQGMKLSGGQRQRISIARALLKNPPILILDEATSALDSESEKLVQEAIYELMKNRTALVIAHRLSTVQHADQILVIKDGMIEESGKHEELVQKDGLYNRLIKMQSL
jgi:subfamily B ATP-binding cassette protein MsbA